MTPLRKATVVLKWALILFWKRNWEFLVIILPLFVAAGQLFADDISALMAEEAGAVLNRPRTYHVVDDDATAVSQAYARTLGPTVAQAAKSVRLPPGFGENLTANTTASVMVEGYDVDDVRAASRLFYVERSGLGDIDFTGRGGALGGVVLLLGFLAYAAGSRIFSNRKEGLFAYTNNFLDARWVVVLGAVPWLVVLLVLAVAMGLSERAIPAGVLAVVAGAAVSARMNPRSWAAENFVVVCGLTVYGAYWLFSNSAAWAWLPIVNVVMDAPVVTVVVSNSLLALLCLRVLRHERFVE